MSAFVAVDMGNSEQIHRVMQGLGVSFAVLLAGLILFLRRAETHRKEVQP